MNDLTKAIELAKNLASKNEEGASLLELLLDLRDAQDQDIDYTQDDLDYEDPEVEAANSRAAKSGGDYWQNDAGEWSCG